jgi:chromate reductase
LSSKKNILVIVGSASENSTNEKLAELIAAQTSGYFNMTIFNQLKSLPHFDPQLSTDDPPKEIIAFRTEIENADGVIISSPEYVFSIPSGLKNAIEWCVATTIFSDKPLGIITASAAGKKGHEELQLIMQTLTAKFTPDTTLLIEGIKGKMNDKGELTDEKTKNDLVKFILAFRSLLGNS